jgi:hypothetical protein
MKLGRLTDAGIGALEAHLDALRADPTTGSIQVLLTEPGLVVPLDADVKAGTFPNRFAFASYIDDVMTGAAVRPFQRDPGLWAWLTIFYFDQVCPPKEDGVRQVKALPRYVPRFDSWKRYYRHLLAGPWFIYAAHREAPERAMALLAGSLDAPGDVVEQLASRQEIVSCPALMEAISFLYFNRRTGKIRRGAAGQGAGSARRIPTIVKQFNLTWDFFSMTAPEVLKLLPSEFDRFRTVGTSADE